MGWCVHGTRSPSGSRVADVSFEICASGKACCRMSCQEDEGQKSGDRSDLRSACVLQVEPVQRGYRANGGLANNLMLHSLAACIPTHAALDTACFVHTGSLQEKCVCLWYVYMYMYLHMHNILGL